MSFHSASIAVFCLVSAGVAIAIAIRGWQNRHRAGGIWLSVCMSGVALWSFGQSLSLIAGTFFWMRGSYALTLVGVAIAPLAWFLFSARYAGSDGWLTRQRLLVLWIIPTIFAVVAISNFKELVFVNPRMTDSGTFTFTWGSAAWGYFFFHESAMITGEGLLARKFLHSRNLYRQRTGVFCVSGLVLLVGHLASFFRVSPLPQYTTVPVLLLVVGAGAAVLLSGNQLLRSLPFDRLLAPIRGSWSSLTPMARDLVIEEMGSGVIIYDGDGRIVDVNPAGRRILGGTNQRIIGKRYTEIINSEAYLDTEPEFLSFDGAQEEFSNVWIKRDDGTPRCYDIVINDLSSTTEAPSGTVAIVHDVTKKNRRKQQLQAQKQELERQNEQLEEFASIVSHDLRNPLNVATGHVQMAKAKEDFSYLDNVEQAHCRMEELIEDMLTLAKQGRTVDETEPVHLADVVNKAWDTVETDGVTLNPAVENDWQIEGSPKRLQQLFENLFRNTVEHGTTDVTVTVGTTTNGFFVADDGPGFPDSDPEVLLEQGYTTAEDGTGFGLAIVQTIVEAHGWSLTLGESEVGGARVEIVVDNQSSPRASA